MLDQWPVVTTGVTQIDRLKGEDNVVEHDVNEVFGTRGFDFSWLVPTEVTFPESIKDEIFGYCVPCMEGDGVEMVRFGEGGAEESKGLLKDDAI